MFYDIFKELKYLFVKQEVFFAHVTMNFYCEKSKKVVLHGILFIKEYIDYIKMVWCEVHMVYDVLHC